MLPRLTAQCRMHANQPLIIRYISSLVKGLRGPMGGDGLEPGGNCIMLFEDGQQSSEKVIDVACAALPKTFILVAESKAELEFIAGFQNSYSLSRF